jgi:hypothetical protein
VCRRAVEVAERFADGQADERERGDAHDAARNLMEAWSSYDLGLGVMSAFAAFAAHADAGESFLGAARVESSCRLPERTPEPIEAARRARSCKQCDVLRDIVGDPFRPSACIDARWLAWNDGAISKLAQVIYEDRAFDRLPLLADALEDAGCSDADLLGHLREPGLHVRGCWATDLLLGRG